MDSPLCSPPVTGSNLRSPPQQPPLMTTSPPLSPPIKTMSLFPRGSNSRNESVTAPAEDQTERKKEATAVTGSEENHTASVNEKKTIGLEAVTGYTIKLPPKESMGTVPRALSVGEEAVTVSAVKPPPEESKVTVPRAVSLRGDAVKLPPKESVGMVSRAGSSRDEAVTGSPVRSPKFERQSSFYSVSSSNRSPLHDLENQIPSPLHKDSPNRGTMTVGSILLSPLGSMSAIEDTLEKVTSPMVPVANRMVSRETTSTSKLGGTNGVGRGLERVEERLIPKSSIRISELGPRIAALVFSLISIIVMASDKTKGWDGDSFDRYTEFRYCLSINVIVSAYSLFQCSDQFVKIKLKLFMSYQISHCFDFFMDQILAYFLMSASSSAASRNGAWVADFGSDKFTKQMKGAVAMSFLTFFALAFSSVISAYRLFSWHS